MAEFSAFSDEKHQPFFKEGNAGRIAILVHGFPGTPYEMQLIGEIFHDQGYSVKGLLLPGFGNEIAELAQKSRHEWLEAIRKEVEEANSEFDEVILVGYSFGGALSINLLHDFPELELHTLVLIAPFWDLFAQYNWFIRFFGPIVWPIGRIFNPDIKVYENVDFDDLDQRKDIEDAFDGIDLDDPEVRKFLKNIKIPFKIIDEIYKIGKSALKKIGNINTQILILQGSNDKIVTPNATNKLVKHLNGSYVYREIAGMTHEFIRPDHNNRETIETLITEFLE